MTLKFHLSDEELEAQRRKVTLSKLQSAGSGIWPLDFWFTALVSNLFSAVLSLLLLCQFLCHAQLFVTPWTPYTQLFVTPCTPCTQLFVTPWTPCTQLFVTSWTPCTQLFVTPWTPCTQLFVTPWTPCTPGSPVLPCLPEFSHIHVHWVIALYTKCENKAETSLLKNSDFTSYILIFWGKKWIGKSINQSVKQKQ